MIYTTTCKTCETLAAQRDALKAALASIQTQAECNTETAPEGATYRCWFKEYGRHAPDCKWEIAEDAEAALALCTKEQE